MRGQPGSRPRGPDPTRSGAGGTGHSRARVAARGPGPKEADAAVVLLHGRGGSPEGMLTLADELADELRMDGLTWLAPQADNSTWYPRSFLAEVEENEPWLSSALGWLDDTVRDLSGQGISPDRVAFVGFSQGACLASEFVARSPRYYGGVAVLSGGLIGPPGTDFRDRYRGAEGGDAEGAGGASGDAEGGRARGADAEAGGYPARGGSLDLTPIFLGCSDEDPHIPEERVRESAHVLEEMGAEVSLRIYPGMGHRVNEDERERVASLLQDLLR